MACELFVPISLLVFVDKIAQFGFLKSCGEVLMSRENSEKGGDPSNVRRKQFKKEAKS